MIYQESLDVFVIALMWSLVAGLVLCVGLVAYLQRDAPDTSMLWAVASEGEPLLLDYPLADYPQADDFGWSVMDKAEKDHVGDTDEMVRNRALMTEMG